jgi:hypothetical protein
VGFFDALGGGAAASGAALGGPVGAGLAGAGALIGGIFGGGKPKIPKELQRLYALQLQQARQMQAYSRGIPLSDPQEQAALASQRGLYGEQARAGAANAGAAYNMNQGMQGLPDFLQGLQAQQQGGLQQIQSGALQQSLLARQQAGPQAAQLAAGAVGAAQYQQQPDLSAAFGSLARLIGYNQTLRANGGGNQPQNGVGHDTAPASFPTQQPGLGPAINQYVPHSLAPMPQAQPNPLGTLVNPLAQAPTPQYGLSSNPSQLLNTSLGR